MDTFNKKLCALIAALGLIAAPLVLMGQGVTPGIGGGVAESSGSAIPIIQADKSSAINVSTATTSQLVALSSGQKIYVTSFDIVSASNNVTFVYGTGTNCATGTTALTGTYNLSTLSVITKGNGLGPILIVPAGNALCIVNAAATQTAGSISYTQF